MSSEPGDITGFLYEIGVLKRYPRTGWLLAGVPAPESVAEHSLPNEAWYHWPVAIGTRPVAAAAMAGARRREAACDRGSGNQR